MITCQRIIIICFAEWNCATHLRHKGQGNRCHYICPRRPNYQHDTSKSESHRASCKKLGQLFQEPCSSRTAATCVRRCSSVGKIFGNEVHSSDGFSERKEEATTGVAWFGSFGARTNCSLPEQCVSWLNAQLNSTSLFYASPLIQKSTLNTNFDKDLGDGTFSYSF